MNRSSPLGPKVLTSVRLRSERTCAQCCDFEKSKRDNAGRFMTSCFDGNMVVRQKINVLSSSMAQCGAIVSPSPASR